MRFWALALIAGCVPGSPGATLGQLYQRSSHDLRCAELKLSHIDTRTKIVSGCGRELVYVEDCQVIREVSDCTWRLETPVPLVAAHFDDGEIVPVPSGGDAARVDGGDGEIVPVPARPRDDDPGF